jgi:hypothetical protein
MCRPLTWEKSGASTGIRTLNRASTLRSSRTLGWIPRAYFAEADTHSDIAQDVDDAGDGLLLAIAQTGGLMSYGTRAAALWAVVIVAFCGAFAAVASNSPTGGSAGGFVAAGAVTAIIRERRRREAWVDHLEWHRKQGTRCPDDRDGQPPPWGVPPPH